VWECCFRPRRRTCLKASTLDGCGKPRQKLNYSCTVSSVRQSTQFCTPMVPLVHPLSVLIYTPRRLFSCTHACCSSVESVATPPYRNTSSVLPRAALFLFPGYCLPLVRILLPNFAHCLHLSFALWSRFLVVVRQFGSACRSSNGR
jgi:hypothetical protein